MTEYLRVRQLFDCADVARNIVMSGKQAGRPWGIIEGPWTRGGTKYAYYRFLAEMAVAYPRTQLWHVNMGGRAKWARGRFARPYALTLHGTDIRENYWQSAHHAEIKADIDGAGQVWYTTPDLREKAEQARPDAEYLPAPLDFDSLPQWNPASRPKIFFASRWDASKGGDEQIESARQVVDRLSGRDVDVVGLDWGDRAQDAAKAGVRLLPRMSQAEYLRQMATAHVAVGQTAGILAVSELQAMAIGIPTVIPTLHQGYGSDVGAVVVDLEDVAEATLSTLLDPVESSQRLQGLSYVRREHDGKLLIPKLESGYQKALEAHS